MPGWRQAGGRHGGAPDAVLDQVTQAISAVLLGKQEQAPALLSSGGGHLPIEDRPGLGIHPRGSPGLQLGPGL